ncbi:MAG: glutaredoxin [Bdellovibrio sp.]|nr:glutaredoxin [Bdellovibrio sp.]
MRKILSADKVHAEASKKILAYHSPIVDEVESAIKGNEWVIVGMRQNPVVKSAKKLLTEKNIRFHYIEHGSYFSEWKKRLAIKLWSGWPTFPQVFHNGILIGGYEDLKAYLK